MEKGCCFCGEFATRGNGYKNVPPQLVLGIHIRVTQDTAMRYANSRAPRAESIRSRNSKKAEHPRGCRKERRISGREVSIDAVRNYLARRDVPLCSELPRIRAGVDLEQENQKKQSTVKVFCFFWCSCGESNSGHLD